MNSALLEINHNLHILPCLFDLEEEKIALIGQKAHVKNFAKNDIIFSELHPADFFFIVRKGAIKLYKTSSEGRELIVKIMCKGDYFCCMPLYSGGRYFVNAMATEDSTLVVIPAVDFREMLKNIIGETGMRIILGLCSKVKHLSNLVEDITFKDVEQRVLLTLFRLIEEKPPENGIATLTLTHQNIASMTGTVREVVSRIMSQLKKEGIIIDSNIRSFKIDRDMLLSLAIKRGYSQINNTA
jgi:CRP/FNR family transcriptional regulator